MLPGIGAWFHNTDLLNRLELKYGCNVTSEDKKKDKIGRLSGMPMN